MLADRSDVLNMGFYVPLARYGLLTLFAVACARVRERGAASDVVSPH